MNKFAFSLLAGGALLAQSAFGQSIGVSFISDTNSDISSGISDNFPDSMLGSDMAGAPPYTQTNWNNFGARGSGTFTLTNSVGGTVPIVAAWDSGHADSTGTALGLGTGDGKLMDGFLYSWNPGSAPRDPLASSISGSSIGDKPVVYLRGLNAWINSIPKAEGYGIVVYTTGYSFFEVGEYWIESVTGDPLASTMVSGSDLSPHYFTQDTQSYLGTYTQATSTNINTPTGAGNYAVLTGFTNDAVLIRVYSSGYSAGLNAFQLVPIFQSAPTVATPTFSPSDTVFALQSVTVSEAATGDPFHPALFYQWLVDNNGGPVTNVIQNATNSTFNVTPTNSAAAYAINYAVVVSNIFGVSTSAVATLNVNPAVLPFVTQDTTPGPGNNAAGVFAYVGGSVTFSAAFGGPPSTYLWQSNNVNIPGATSTTLTLNNLQLSQTANYSLTATNSVGGFSSTPAALTVLPALAAPTSATPYPNDVFTNGPVAYWRFAETADNVGNSIQAYDYSGHNFHATYGNGVLNNQPGPQAPTFPGFESTNTAVSLINNIANSSLIAPSLNLNANTVTITAWINPPSESAFNGIFVWANGNDKAGFSFGGTVNGSGVAELGYVWSTNNPATFNFHSGLFPPANQWSFAALTITPTNSTMYLYYVDIGTGATNLLKSVQTINNISEPFSGGTTWIGSDTSQARNFNGSLDEVAVFNKTLSEAQLQDLFLKGIGATGVAPNLSPAQASISVPVYSGQNIILSVTNVSATVPFTLQWQAGPDGTTWTNVPGATASMFVANPLIVGNVFYQLVAVNGSGSGASAPVMVTYTALPVTPPGIWTANYQITNNVLNFSTASTGVGHYVGRGVLGKGMSWNVIPILVGAFNGFGSISSLSDLADDGVTPTGVFCTMNNGSSSFSSATTVLPSADIGNLLYQFTSIGNPTNALQFHGVPDGNYNLAVYACDGSFGDRGSTLVAHGANGDQTQSTVNASPIVPLAVGVNTVLFTNVQVVGGALSVDVFPNSPLPTHNPNTEADINAAQLQLVSYATVPPVVTLNQSFSGSTFTLSWPQGVLQTATNLFGPWTPISSPSPVSVVTTNKDQFFRVKVR